MTQDSVDRAIREMKRHLGAFSDSDLAKRLGVSRSTVHRWRERGSIPAKFNIPPDSLVAIAANTRSDRRLFSMREIVDAHPRAVSRLDEGEIRDLNGFLVTFLLELEEAHR